jgi:hypothetical protein
MQSQLGNVLHQLHLLIHFYLCHFLTSHFFQAFVPSLRSFYDAGARIGHGMIDRRSGRCALHNYASFGQQTRTTPSEV